MLRHTHPNVFICVHIWIHSMVLCLLNATIVSRRHNLDPLWIHEVLRTLCHSNNMLKLWYRQRNSRYPLVLTCEKKHTITNTLQPIWYKHQSESQMAHANTVNTDICAMIERKRERNRERETDGERETNRINSMLELYYRPKHTSAQFLT